MTEHKTKEQARESVRVYLKNKRFQDVPYNLALLCAGGHSYTSEEEHVAANERFRPLRHAAIQAIDDSRLWRDVRASGNTDMRKGPTWEFLVWCRDEYGSIDPLVEEAAEALGLFAPPDESLPDISAFLGARDDRERILMAAFAVISRFPDDCMTAKVAFNGSRKINRSALARLIFEHWGDLYPHHEIRFKSSDVLTRTLSKWLRELPTLP